jgi:hypothetical protein
MAFKDYNRKDLTLGMIALVANAVAIVVFTLWIGEKALTWFSLFTLVCQGFAFTMKGQSPKFKLAYQKFIFNSYFKTRNLTTYIVLSGTIALVTLAVLGWWSVLLLNLCIAGLLYLDYRDLDRMAKESVGRHEA